jgi:MtN3 and saliva related transmembrane protein
METTEIIGLVAATLTTAAYVPQVYKLFRSKSTADISLTMYSVLFTGILLWFIYGIKIESLAIVLANSITGLLVAGVINLKLKYK